MTANKLYRHREDSKIMELNDLFDHTTEQSARAVELYNKVDLLASTLPTAGAPSTSHALNEFNEFESLLAKDKY